MGRLRRMQPTQQGQNQSQLYQTPWPQDHQGRETEVEMLPKRPKYGGIGIIGLL
jgi:hypothetical protein